ncbi:hypothetical protein C8D86_10322 [Aquicella lusitana]|uniref:Uncharacterized protein n=1 Tax=Aquicella lusitana TaxID=254246 RepID=A0A370GWM6_9COXI|nr:hypothetical protein C8D86_10322 [Aquicella lusitana]
MQADCAKYDHILHIIFKNQSTAMFCLNTIGFKEREQREGEA